VDVGADRHPSDRVWVKGQPLRFRRGHVNRTKRRPLLGPADYRVEYRGYETPCWIRAAKARNGKGYGVVVIAGRFQLAHRAMWEQENGPVPDGRILDHLCRQHDCMRPDHCEPVTPAENIRRGRGTKLTPDQVAAIRADSRRHRVIAVEYGISNSHVSRIKSGEKWRDNNMEV
jgi:hypothetical protein